MSAVAEQKHSRSYHRYFEDYAESQVLDENGRVIIRRVYVGRYYRVKLSDRSLRRQKLLFVLLYLLAAVLFLWAGSTLRVSAVGAAAVFTAAALIALLWLAVPVFRRLTAPREMEVRAWRESAEQLRHVSLGAAVCLLACAVVTCGVCAASPDHSMAEAVPGLILYVLSGGLALAIHLLERRTEYEILPPKHQRPEGSSPIRYYAPD